LGFGFACAVGRTSPACQAVRSPARNAAIGGGVAGVTLASYAVRSASADQHLLCGPHLGQQPHRVEVGAQRLDPPAHLG
jgi:hypothetical protein